MPEVLNNPSVVRVRAALEAAGMVSAIIELPGVAPVGHATRVAPYVEKSLAAYREIWAAAGHPHTVFRLSYEDLLRITGGLAVEVAA